MLEVVVAVDVAVVELVVVVVAAAGVEAVALVACTVPASGPGFAMDRFVTAAAATAVLSCSWKPTCHGITNEWTALAVATMLRSEFAVPRRYMAEC